MAATLEKREVLLKVGQLLDQCRECPKNIQTRELKEMEAICGTCPVYEQMKTYRDFLGASEGRKRGRGKRRESRFHLLTPELYRQHKADDWLDDDVMREYAVGRHRLIRWKKEHFSEEELAEMRLPVGRKKA